AGTLAGGYVTGPRTPDTGTRYDLVGIGSLVGLGETTLTGDLHSTGSARTGHADGFVTLHAARGNVTLRLDRPRHAAFAPLPSRSHFTVTSGSGVYKQLHGPGTLFLPLITASHTLTLTLEPK